MFASAMLAAAQNQAPATSPALPALPNNANEYVRQVIEHELDEQEHDHTLWRYYIHREGRNKKDQTPYSYDREVIQTNEGEISRPVLWNGQPVPLSPEYDKHMRQWLKDQAERAKHQKREKADEEKVRKLLGAGPDAFNFQYDGEEDGLVRLRFTPKPHYDAPTRELRIFRSLSGKVWIDRASSRLARVDGALFEDVTFGLGLVGRVNKGGIVKFVRHDMGSGHWDFVSFDLNASGHAAIFSSIVVNQRLMFSNYIRVPDTLTLAQAYDLLVKDTNPSNQH
jgi:hypothetical protein